MHQNKIFNNYIIKISFIYKNQEFSSASFPHVFKAIGPLEKVLNRKKPFFSCFKKVTFSVCRILRCKMEKMTHFWHIFDKYFLYAENHEYWKSNFYHAFLQLKSICFYHNFVSLYYGDFKHFLFVNFYNSIDFWNSVFERIISRKIDFSGKKSLIFVQNPQLK